MATIPSPQTWVTDRVIGAREMNNQVRDTVGFLLSPPRAWTYLKANQSIADQTWSDLDLLGDFEDSDNMLSLLSAVPVDIKTPGQYRINWSARFGAIATGNRRAARILVNGVVLKTVIRNTLTNYQTTVADVTFVSLAAGDQITMQAWHNRGSDMNLAGQEPDNDPPGQYMTFLQVRYIGQ